jgi:hypothetical protein
MLLACLLFGCADLWTTNVILNHGLGELNPFMRLTQTWLGAWWVVPKLALTFVLMYLLGSSNNRRHIAYIVAFTSMPVINNLVIIAGLQG